MPVFRVASDWRRISVSLHRRLMVSQFHQRISFTCFLRLVKRSEKPSRFSFTVRNIRIRTASHHYEPFDSRHETERHNTAFLSSCLDNLCHCRNRSASRNIEYRRWRAVEEKLSHMLTEDVTWCWYQWTVPEAVLDFKETRYRTRADDQ